MTVDEALEIVAWRETWGAADPVESALAAEVRKLRAMRDRARHLAANPGLYGMKSPGAVARRILGGAPVELPLIIMMEPEGAYRCTEEGCDWIEQPDPYAHAVVVHEVTNPGDVNVVHPDDH